MDQEQFSRLYAAFVTQFTEDIPFWLHLAESSGGPILELGCGPGRVLHYLANEGWAVLGLDNDENMLNWARSQTPQKLQEKITLIHGDIHNFCLADQYPLIIIPCNTFSYFEDHSALQALKCIKLHLSQEGQLAMAIPNPSQYASFEADVSKNGLPESEPINDFIEPTTGNPVQVYVSEEFDKKENILQVLWIFDELFPDGKVNRLYHPATYHLRSLEETVDLLRHAQLDIKAVFGDYQRGPVDQNSHEIIIVAANPSEN
jgi:SAM-dependent methyltransferase